MKERVRERENGRKRLSEFWCGSEEFRSSEKFRKSRKFKKFLEFKNKIPACTQVNQRK